MLNLEKRNIRDKVEEPNIVIIFGKTQKRVNRLNIYGGRCSSTIGGNESLNRKQKSYRSEKTNILIKVKELINNVKGTTSEKASDRSSGSVSGDSFTRNKHMNLPRLHLPKFGGDILEFQEFWDQFTTIIDNREVISEVNKFSYLQSLLLGYAKSCLQVLALTAVNYDTAKEILLRRYGRTEKVIVAHIQKLLNISAKVTLWEMYDQVQVHVRSLANLIVTGQNYGLVLAPIILHQLPHGVRLEWARTGEGKGGDVEYLLNFLHEEIQRRERSHSLIWLPTGPQQVASRRYGRNRPKSQDLVSLLWVATQAVATRSVAFVHSHTIATSVLQ
ncbi:hypothetical protein PoB_004083000 [Plakobranchus ocellatus]|uniref:Uncharacterized protein n=1 Tax=Plakobranchus ocellatus TaxID=259542 RepID=A0AAV4B5I3_9GAST|nr:hypothetical protein PoB_004083000 [Plakobranchus ocellatus]